jgi:MFS transporter, DHA2 family, multidrug resistance protein
MMSASASPNLVLTYSPALDRVVKLLIVLVVTLVTSMEFLTSYAIGVALPDIQGDLAASFDEGSWIITAYTTAFIIGLVLSNWLSARIGYRRYMMGAVAVFMAASVGCGLSHTLPQMLVLRCIMGFAGGNFLVRGQVAIYLTHTGKSRLKALVVFAFGVVALARTFGPTIGGYLTEWYTWRSIFFINVPVSITALILLAFFLPDVKAKDDNPHLDLAGLLLLIGWVAPLQILLSRGERDDWFADPFICLLALLILFCSLLFLWWQVQPSNRRPIISFRVYRSRNFVIGSLIVIIIGMMLYGQMYFVPQFLRGVQHHSAWGTGKLQTINTIAFTFGLFGGAILMRRLGLRLALACGASIFAVGMYLWTVRLTPDISDVQMFLPLALTGFGAGWEIGPVSTLINSQIPDPFLGEAMELYLFQRQLGGTWGIAILTILVDRRRSFWSNRLGEHLNLYDPHLQDAMFQGTALMRSQGFAESQEAATVLVHGQLLIQSTVNAFADTFAYQMALGVVALVLILLLARGRSLVNAFRWIVAIVR